MSDLVGLGGAFGSGDGIAAGTDTSGGVGCGIEASRYEPSLELVYFASRCCVNRGKVLRKIVIGVQEVIGQIIEVMEKLLRRFALDFLRHALEHAKDVSMRLVGVRYRILLVQGAKLLVWPLQVGRPIRGNQIACVAHSFLGGSNVSGSYPAIFNSIAAFCLRYA